MRKVIFQDTTLRDGEQSKGIAFNYVEKLKIAKTMCELGVDSIELGFPASSVSEKLIIKKLFTRLENNKVKLCLFSRAKKSDIIEAFECSRKSKNARLQIVMPTSEIQILHSINLDKKNILEKIKEIMLFARDYFSDIQFTAQDATRANKNFLQKVLLKAAEFGAQTLCVPDTTGFATPNEYAQLITFVRKIIKKNDVKISAHCHNDLGLATANTLSAIYNGADQVECTFRGLGERAGNTPFEEVLAILDLKHKDLLSKKINLNIINRAKNILENITGIDTHVNKPILGSNVFTHASGMHQKAVIKNKKTFEVLEAEKFGFKGGNIAIGKLSGKVGLMKILKGMNLDLEDKHIDTLISLLKKEAIREKIISEKKIKNIYMSFKRQNKVKKLRKKNKVKI